MKPKLEKINLNSSSSITVKKEVTPFMDYPWHYHPEYEIIYVEKSYGIRLMGNHIGNFSDGDLMFISPNLPHVWKNDNDFYQNNPDLNVVVYVIHFREDIFGDKFFDLLEFVNLRKLFLRGQQGLLVKRENHQELSELIKKVYESSGIDRLIVFIRTLEKFSETTDYQLLSNPGYIGIINFSDTYRINKVVDFLMKNHNRIIKTEEISRLVNMNKSSFCRYFKSRTHKTCSHFLNEIRIAHACKLLVNSNMTATQICYETGYNNISHFNRQFRLITNTTTKNYAKTYSKNV